MAQERHRPTQMKSRLRLEIKQISDEGSFEGLLSPYNNVDLVGDLVEPGAYKKTLNDRGSKIPLLWQHKADTPIGDLTLEDRADGLYCRGQLLMELPEAKKAHLLIKARIVRGLSIGFETVKDAVEAGVRRLKEIKLYEGSIVTFPANESALIMAVKNRALPGEQKAADMADMCMAMCRICSDVCESAIYYCYDAGGTMAAPEHLGFLADCISSCDFCCGAMYRESASMAEICALCETICRRCAEACAAWPSDAVMMACADACNSCADCCHAMAGSTSQAGMETMSRRAAHEIKAGRVISAANAAKIQTCIEALTALLEEAASDGTSKSGAARETKPEPEQLHSAIVNQIKALKETFVWTPLKSN